MRLSSITRSRRNIFTFKISNILSPKAGVIILTKTYLDRKIGIESFSRAIANESDFSSHRNPLFPFVSPGCTVKSFSTVEFQKASSVLRSAIVAFSHRKKLDKTPLSFSFLFFLHIGEIRYGRDASTCQP